MPFRISIVPTVVDYEASEKERWRNGDREDCSAYMRKLRGTEGFGEFVVGRHFERNGYEWIHHDFDLFGFNKSGKYPANDVLAKCLGKRKVEALHKATQELKPWREDKHILVEQPDLMIYKSDYSDLRFAECKRLDTRDKLNRRQVLGFMLIGAVLCCPIEVFVVRERGKSGGSSELEFIYGK